MTAMEVIHVSRPVWTKAEELLSHCGRLGRECIVYFCGESGRSSVGVATAAYHPTHIGSAVSYEVSVPQLLKLNVWLRRRQLSVLAQLHTHPGEAFHSGTDDRWPTVETIGFLSLVVPDFGRRGLLGLPGCYLAEYLGSGHWREVHRAEMLRRIRLES